MNPLQYQMPVLTVTNPILLWLFRHGWEDPEWGRMPVGQVALAAAIYEMAGQLGDVEVRKQIQTGAAKAMAAAAERMVVEQ